MRASRNMDAWYEMLELLDRENRTQEEENRLEALSIMFSGPERDDSSKDFSKYKIKVVGTKHWYDAIEQNHKAIKEFMKNSGYKRKELSELTEISYTSIRKWVGKQSLPKNAVKVEQFYKATGIKLKSMVEVEKEVRIAKGICN